MARHEWELLPTIAKAYRLTILAYKPVRNIWRLETNRGVFALKKALPAPEADQLRAAEIHLASRGFTRFTRHFPAENGDPECVAGDGQRYVLYRWLPGSPPGRDPEHPEDLALAARAAAEMHLASLGFKSPQNLRVAWGYWPSELAEKTEEMRNAPDIGDREGRFARLFRRWLPAALDEAEMARCLTAQANYPAVAREAAEKGGICHGDLAVNNILIHNGQAYLLDFDRMELNVFPSDLATFLRRILTDSGWDPGLCFRILEAYQELSPFSRDEIRVLISFLHWPQTFWRLGRQYFVDKIARRESYFLSRLWRWSSQRSPRENLLKYLRERLW